MKRTLSLVLVGAAACWMPSSTTVLSYVQLGSTETFDDQWWVDPPCRPSEADPAGVLAPTGDGRWMAVAIGQTRIPCGADDAIAVHVRETHHLVVTAPARVHQGENFSVHVAAHDRDGHVLHRNAEPAVFELVDGLDPGSRDGCMDLRSNHGDDRLVHASTVGEGRIHVELGGVEAYADVTIEP